LYHELEISTLGFYSLKISVKTNLEYLNAKSNEKIYIKIQT